ncbi:peptide chain release factor N(5)-glutamine methyltransferase [Parablautia muri]|uniref:Release factor glutamine methyltransferase n=1 Tax=Parablautia muri TaxID=2320879 RepID=A0A9X5GSP6_9FIRM|nr:peptide chain release factor N(5)-glutamine methyltransferase [Parablautia muri]NBJ93130.1 peptide chain release factor N(5)-glutamine methyltransferase [Parablautia muri]
MEYKALYEMGVNQLKEAGIEEASLDARLLLEDICGTTRNDLLAHGDKQVGRKQYERYVSQIEKRKQHIPLQHILGYQEFMGLKFKATPKALIPRQDTETLVEEAMRCLNDGMRILDLCTGSGCILLSLLNYSNSCQGVGSDLSEEALETARENAKNLSLSAEFIQSDLFEKIEGKYEMIVSNPPYIPSGEIPKLMEEVRDHDPIMALDGGEDGLYFYREIVKTADRYLYPGGRLFFEIGCEQGPAVRELMEKAGYRGVTICQDLSGLDRVVSGVYLG